MAQPMQLALPASQAGSSRTLQAILATALLSLGETGLPQCPRRLSLLAYQLRFVAEHDEAEHSLREAAADLRAQVVESLCRQLRH